jgi:DNA-binding NtrC family response regulator
MDGKLLKVLVVDDEPAVRNALAILFDIHGIPQVSTATAAEALELMRSEPVGVVLQDMNFTPGQMSGEEGVELFRQIRAIDAEVPVLLMTAFASVQIAVQLIKEGANDYLPKPWDDDKLVVTLNNLLRLRRLQIENAQLRLQRQDSREALAERFDLCGLVYESDEIHRVVSMATQVAASDAPVLVTGPSGAGKEKLAEIVQANSRRREKPFLRVNVGALPEELMEAELFGAESGAYTGATSRRIGYFESADGGTLFLDEIDALSLAGQVKLLRVVQTGEFQRLGSSQTRRSDVRLISATNSELQAAVAAGTFREDLYYRLNVIELKVPALRHRPEDVLPLAEHFLRAAAGDGPPVRLTEDAQAALLHHDWQGNVRELENRLRRAQLTCDGGVIAAIALDLEPMASGQASMIYRKDSAVPADPERIKIERALVEAKGIVVKAAERLGLSRQALYRKMDKFGIVLERRPR